jgi:hypothetical protein
MEMRLLASAASSGATFDLRCELREKLIGFLAQEYPDCLPRNREEWPSTGPTKPDERRQGPTSAPSEAPERGERQALRFPPRPS